jgi:hypothetical protein
LIEGCPLNAVVRADPSNRAGAKTDRQDTRPNARSDPIAHRARWLRWEETNMNNDSSQYVRRGLVLLALGLATAAARAAPADVFCTPNQVVVFTEAPRLHVRCDESYGGVVYFAAGTNDAAQAARILSIIQTALVAGRTLVINYDASDLSGTAIGCQPNDCRLIRRIGFGK